MGDNLVPQGNHSRNIITSSASVFIDGKPAARSGDKVNCGGILLGRSTVNVG